MHRLSVLHAQTVCLTCTGSLFVLCAQTVCLTCTDRLSVLRAQTVCLACTDRLSVLHAQTVCLTCTDSLSCMHRQTVCLTCTDSLSYMHRQFVLTSTQRFPLTHLCFCRRAVNLRQLPRMYFEVSGWPFCSGSSGSVPDQSVWDLWWTKWHWGRFFSPRTSVTSFKLSCHHCCMFRCQSDRQWANERLHFHRDVVPPHPRVLEKQAFSVLTTLNIKTAVIVWWIIISVSVEPSTSIFMVDNRGITWLLKLGARSVIKSTTVRISVLSLRCSETCMSVYCNSL